MRNTGGSIIRRGLPDWLIDARMLAAVFILGFAAINVTKNLLRRPTAIGGAPTCAPFPHGPYQPGRTPVSAWSGRILEQFQSNYSSKKYQTGYILDAMARCPVANCSEAMAQKYYNAILSYAWIHVVLARDADIASGDEGVRYVNTLFGTEDDMKILADLRNRVATKWFNRSTYDTTPAIRIMVEGEPRDFSICRPKKPDYNLVPGTFESNTRNPTAP